MTSMQGYAQQTDYSFMYDIPDLRSNQTEPKFYDPETITGFIYNNPDFSITKFLLDKSQNDEKYSDIQAYNTFFAVQDKDILTQHSFQEFETMDLYTARQIVNYNTIPKTIKPSLLLNLNDIIQIQSKITSQWLYIRNFGGDVYVNEAKILFIKECKNGVIYILDKLLIPDVIYS